MPDPQTPPDRPRLRDMLEPRALMPRFPESERDSAWEIEIEASKAISLKRIADVLDQNLGANAWCHEGTLNCILQQINLNGRT